MSHQNITKVTSLDNVEVQTHYIKDEVTSSVCRDLQITPTRIANGYNVLQLAVKELCHLAGLYFAIDSNNCLVQINQNLEMNKTGLFAAAMCCTEKQLYLYQDDAINVYTWMGRLQLS